jgi:hypothetical protein
VLPVHGKRPGRVAPPEGDAAAILIVPVEATRQVAPEDGVVAQKSASVASVQAREGVIIAQESHEQHPERKAEDVVGKEDERLRPVRLPDSHDSPGYILERFVPGDLGPLPVASLTGSPERMEKPIRMVDDLSEMGSFGADETLAQRMAGIPGYLGDFPGLFVDVGQNATIGITLMAHCRNNASHQHLLQADICWQGPALECARAL